MSIKISEVFEGLVSQQLSALITILEKAGSHAAEANIKDQVLLEARLQADMHPLSWQIQTTLELMMRGIARLSGKELPSLVLNEESFAALIARAETIQADLSKLDTKALDESVETIFELPIGPDATLSLSGRDYLLKFLLPNFYFHLTTVYALLRMKGVPLGKRDFMGPIE